MSFNSLHRYIEELDSIDQEIEFLKRKYKDQEINFDKNQEGLTDLLGEEVYNYLYENFGSSGSILEISTFIEDENLIKKLYTYIKSLEKDTNGKKTKKKALAEEIQKGVDIFLIDLNRYKKLQGESQRIRQEQTEVGGAAIKKESLQKVYQRAIMSTLMQQKREKREGAGSYDGEVDKELLDMLGIEEPSDFYEQFRQNQEVRDLAWKYDFFKLVQKSVDKLYIFTYRDLQLIYDILEDIQTGKVVMLTGDTGSGKTELARFLCSEFLNTDYVFVSGSKDLETSDLTLEKVITSKGVLTSNEDDVVSEEETDREALLKKEAKRFVDQIFAKDELREKAKEFVEEGDKESKKQIDSFFEEFDVGKRDLVTEYHIMGLLKGMYEGKPVILDEVNLIRPEIFMALNDYFTRKVGQEIQLPNALGKFTVKEGFGIILTGNDPEQNTKEKRYQQGRYNFDEASYNRLRVYAKGYPYQEYKKFEETNFSNEQLKEDIDYMNSNEMYGILLMMMFNDESDKMSKNKYGFEIMKRDFEGNLLDKNSFFEQMYNFANSISMIQRAFAGENIQLDGNYALTSLSNNIKRKVFSMRNMQEVLEGYKNDTKFLDFHIYDNFIKHTTNKEERYAILAIFNSCGFFGNLVTDDIENSLRNIDRKFSEVKGENKMKKEDIQGKTIITKQDLYNQYFRSFELSDSVFSEVKEDVFSEFDAKGEEEGGEDFESIEDIDKDSLMESFELAIEKIRLGQDFFDIRELMTISKMMEYIKDDFEKNFDSKEQKDINRLNSLLTKLINIFDNPEDNSRGDMIETINQISYFNE